MYVRLNTGLTQYKLIPETENIWDHITDHEKDYYVSIYKYNESQYAQWKRTNKVAGILDVVTDKLVFDFDSIHDVEAAKSDTLTLCGRLLALGVPQDKLQVSFSGQKGFMVEVPTTSELTVDQFKNITKHLAGDLSTFDTVVSDPQRIIRVVGTKHNKTGLRKYPLTMHMLSENSIKDIREMAADYDNIDWEVCDTYGPVELPTPLHAVKNGVPKPPKPTVNTEDLDLTAKPRWLTPAKFALQEGFFGEGERNTAFMILAATYRNQGFNKDIVYRMLKGVAERQAARNDVDRYADTEIYNNILSVVFGDNWNGGQYSKDHEFLVKIATRLKLNVEDESDKVVIEVTDIQKDFEDYAINFEKNIVKTGIPALDENVMFLTNTHNGILGQPGAGKCLGKDTPIRMFDGSVKKVQDVLVGDLLMGDDSSPRTVLSICSGQEQLYRVDQLSGMSYIVNESHILSLKSNFSQVRNKNGKLTYGSQYQKGKTIDIEVRDYLAKSSTFKKYFRGYHVPVEYPEQQTHLDPYFLGLWLGDGSSSKMNIHNPDSEVITYLTSLAARYGYTLTNHANETKCPSWSLTNQKNAKNEVTEALRGYEVINNKHIPKSFLINSRENRLKILAGMLDSDGYYDATKNAYEVTFKVERLAEDLTVLCRSLGLRCTKNTTVKGCMYKGEMRTGTYYRMYISGDSVAEIPCLVARKQAQKRKSKNDSSTSGITLTKLEVGDYYGFEIDGNRRFLLEDYTVTHNTALAILWLEHVSQLGSSALFYSLDMAKPIIYANLVKRVEQVGIKEALRIFKDDERRANSIADKISAKYKNVKFSFKAGTSPESIKDDIKRHEDATGIKTKLLMVDYLDCVAGIYSDATANTGYISNQMKDLASEMGVCSVMLLQTQKFGGAVSDPITSMRRIKGSSIIEQSASVVLTLWREGYDPMTVSQDKFMSFAAVKNRFGPLWQDDFYFKGTSGHIWEIDENGRQEISDLRKEKKEKKANEEEAGRF